MKLSSPNSEGLSDEEFEEYKQLTTEENTLSERKVLKVGNGNIEPPMDMNAQQPPMDGQEGGEMEMNPQDAPEMGNDGSVFDTNFDAGVEADEDEDPKKYIQQLTGKLSQELSKYNNEMGEPDVELGKYVGGMIVKQVAKTLDDAGKKELIKKINTTKENDESEDTQIGDDEMSDDMAMDDAIENTPQNESYIINKDGINKILENFKK